MSFFRAVKWQLLVWILVAFVGPVCAAELALDSPIYDSVSGILNNSGIKNELPGKMKAASQAMPSAQSSAGVSPVAGDGSQAVIKSDLPGKMKATSQVMPSAQPSVNASPAVGDGPQVNGLMVRFNLPDVKLLSRQNLPPPQDLIEEINRLAQIPLTFVRAMSLDSFVFRFAAPLSWTDAQIIIDRIKQSPHVEKVSPDTQETHTMVPDDPDFTKQYNLLNPTAYAGPALAMLAGSANLQSAWDVTKGSSATVVAIVDTGIRGNSEFYSRILPGYDFITNTLRANDGDGRDADPTDPGDWYAAGECGTGSTQQDSSWHGTHIAGIIAAGGNNSSAIAGVNWNTRILPVRVLGKCGGDLSDTIDGMQWAAGISVPGVPDNPYPAKIINMSLTGQAAGGCSDATNYPEAINKIKAKGALIVVAAGNDDNEAASSIPASCAGVMTVGAVDPYGYRASYSNYSQQYKVAISAPGGDMTRYGETAGILSTVNMGKTTPTYAKLKYMHGTSMAAPHVAGVASLALALDPLIAPEMLQLSILLAARDFPSDSQCAEGNAADLFPLCGLGILDATRTLTAVAALKPYVLVYEYFNVDLIHFFRTASAAESSSVLTGGAGDGWRDTQDYFLAWRDASQGAVPVCRFYGTPGIGPNSHFYTADASECATVKKDRGWTYEGIAYYVKLPVNKVCPSGTTPVYRLYNDRWMYNDSNHRFTTDQSEVQDLVKANWSYEGVVMCGV